MTLSQLFTALPDASAEGPLPSFSTVIIGGGPHRLGKDTSGAPALLVSLPASGAGSLAPVELEHIAVQHGARCRLLRQGCEPEAATVTVVRCRESERVVRDYFLSVIDGVLPLIGDSPSEGRVREVVGGVIELFRALELPPRKSIQGLWGELCVIVQAADIATMVAAWHAAPEEPYDFSGFGHRIEVKSAAAERVHHFSLAQLNPPAGTIAVLASLIVERAGGGVSLGEMLDRARQRLGARPELAAQLDQVVAASLGQAWRRGLDERFDWERAQESLAFFDQPQCLRSGRLTCRRASLTSTSRRRWRALLRPPTLGCASVVACVGRCCPPGEACAGDVRLRSKPLGAWAGGAAALRVAGAPGAAL